MGKAVRQTKGKVMGGVLRPIESEIHTAEVDGRIGMHHCASGHRPASIPLR